MFITDGDTIYTENVKYINVIDKRRLAEQMKTPEMNIERAIKMAQTPSPNGTINKQQLDNLTQALQQMRPNITLKLSDVLKQGDKQNLADWGRSIFKIVSKTNWSEHDLQVVLLSKVRKSDRHQLQQSLLTAIQKS